jgi:acyl-CoA thioesterase
MSPHRFGATVSGRWNGLGSGPLGGYALAICVRALQADITYPDVLSLSATFMRPTLEGSAEVRTSVLRRGAQFANSEASLYQAGKETLRVLATFTDLDKAGGRTLMLNDPPHPTPPADAVEQFTPESLPGVELAEHVEYRTSEPVGWFEGTPGGKAQAEFWMRFRHPRSYDAPALAFFVDAAAPMVLELGELGSKTLDLGVHLRARAAGGWLACRGATRHVMNGFHEEDFEIWDSSGTLVAQSRQLAVLTRGEAIST